MNRNSRRRPGRPKGHPKTGGRKAGTPNRVTLEARAAAAEIVDSPTYRRRLLARAKADKLGPMEVWLWRYAKGEPHADSYSAEQVRSLLLGIARAFIDIVQDNELRRRFALEMRRRTLGEVELPPIDASEIAPPSAEPVDDDEEYLTL
jgi:hypothetical protein